MVAHVLTLLAMQTKVHHQEHGFQSGDIVRAVARPSRNSPDLPVGKQSTFRMPRSASYIFSQNSIFPADGPLNRTSDHASVIITPLRVTLPHGGSTAVFATFVPPHASVSTLPVYSGPIEVASDMGTQRVSYLDAVGNLYDRTALDTTDAFFGYKLPAIWNGSMVPQRDGESYS